MFRLRIPTLGVLAMALIMLSFLSGGVILAFAKTANTPETCTLVAGSSTGSTQIIVPDTLDVPPNVAALPTTNSLDCNTGSGNGGAGDKASADFTKNIVTPFCTHEATNKVIATGDTQTCIAGAPALFQSLHLFTGTPQCAKCLTAADVAKAWKAGNSTLFAWSNGTVVTLQSWSDSVLANIGSPSNQQDILAVFTENNGTRTVLGDFWNLPATGSGGIPTNTITFTQIVQQFCQFEFNSNKTITASQVNDCNTLASPLQTSLQTFADTPPAECQDCTPGDLTKYVNYWITNHVILSTNNASAFADWKKALEKAASEKQKTLLTTPTGSQTVEGDFWNYPHAQ